MTMVVDTSALAAVVLGEPDAEAMAAAMRRAAGDLAISAATLVEAHIVVEARQGLEAGADLKALLDHFGVKTVPVDDDQAQAALAAWRRFGRGHHLASLNLGDCFSYALAKVNAAPLLFKGDDFTQTDISAAL